MHFAYRYPRALPHLLLATVLIAVCLVLGVSGTGRAQTDDDDAQARVEFEAGRSAFDERHYADALAAFERSYALSARAPLLYNIGQAADRLRHDARALEAFEQFLAAVPETPLRAPVEERIAVLRAALAARDDGHERDGPQPRRPPRPAPQRSVLGPALVLGAGGLLAVGGAVSLVVGIGDRDSVEGAADGTTLAEVQSAADRAPLLMNGGLVLLGVGLAAASVGLVWLLVPPSSDRDASVAVAPTAGGLLVTGVF